MKRMRGFTLIELMIVVAIIAILASIATSVYSSSIAKSQLSEAFTVVDALKSDVSDYYAQTGSCPTLGAGILSPGASYAGKYVASVSITTGGGGCTITALMRNNTVATKLRGKRVTFTMSGSGGAINWQCTTDVPVVYSPATCH